MRSSAERKLMIEPLYPQLAISTQCQLLLLNRSNFYYVSKGESEENLSIMRELDEQYFKTPFYGALRLTAMLINKGFPVNAKRVRRLMKLVNWRTIYREPHTTISDKTHYKYPYLLRELKIEKTTKFGQWILPTFQ